MEPAGQVLTVGDHDETTLEDRLRPTWQRYRDRWPFGRRPEPHPDSDLGSEPDPEPDPAAEASRRRARRRWLAVLIVAVLALAVWRLTDSSGPAPITRSDVDKAVAAGVAQAQKDAAAVPPDATTAYRTILPSLVTITASGGKGETADGGTSSLGAGVVINADGSILTALHVVADGTAIKVQFADGTQANAKISDRRPDNDIAVLTVDQLPEVVVPAVMGGGAAVGDAVYPVGNPLGLQGSLTAGVVSALDRTIHPEGSKTLKDLIQFDAAVNPGNSGGPLLDREGHVLGIVTALANPSNQPYFIGIGFAVPITTAAGGAGGPSK